MGGRGATGRTRASGDSPFGNAKPLKIEQIGQQHRQGTTIVGRTTWEKNIYEAKLISDEKGIIEIGYANMDYEQISRNKLKGTVNLKAGIVEDKRGYKEHNINWDNIKEIRGKTYNIQDLIKKKGFKWDGTKKAWVR